MGKGVQIAIASFTVFAGILWLVVAQSQGEGTFRYYQNISEYLDGGAGEAEGVRGSQVHGFVEDGSIRKDLPAGYVEFVIHDREQARLAVRYDGIDIPDLFRDGAEVVVEGRFREGVFRADRILAKCPSKYEARREPSGAV